MIHVRLNKVLSALILGLLFAAHISHGYSKWGTLGRDAYLTYESGRFDRYMGPSHPLSATIFGTLAVVFFAAALYEGIAILLAKILPDRKADQVSI
jgi:hypothetical protein